MEHKIGFDLQAFSLADMTFERAYEKNAFEKEMTYLLSFDTDRLLAGFRETAGLDMKGKRRYDGWENMLIGGHTLGHYMTACVQAYCNANASKEDKQDLKKILKDLTDGLRECQVAGKTGFIFGATMLDPTDIEQQFDMVEQGKSHLIKEAWVPYYTLHKIFGGLVAAANTPQLEGIAATAKVIASDLADWVYNRTEKWDEQTHKTVISIEYGGMNDCLYDVYLLTGKEEHKIAASRFDEITLFEKVYQAKSGDDILDGHHANTTIPKFQGALKRYLVTGEKKFLEYVEHFFWMVANNHSYITGDNSEWEHFGKDKILNAERTNCNCETCNAYNMLKICKVLYQLTKDTVYADWYEMTYINSILASQNPETGMTTYFQPMASGYFKTFSDPFTSFWCCTGSGMENFTKLSESYYFHTDNALIVNQFVASTVTWKEKNVTIAQKTSFPLENETSLEVTEGALNGEIWVRLPIWMYEEPVCTVDGVAVEMEKRSFGEGKGYLVLKGAFTKGVKITISLPAKVLAKNLPDGENVYGFTYGPYVLCALLGTEDMEPSKTGVDVTIAKEKKFPKGAFAKEEEVIGVTGDVAQFMEKAEEHLVPAVEGDKLFFTLKDTDAKLRYTLHFSQYKERFGFYFTFVTK